MALLIRPTTTCTSDKRAEEIRQLAAEEGIKLPMPIDAILWFKDRGYVVDLITGVAQKVEIATVKPLALTISHLMTPAVELVEDADVDALLDEVFGKPGLGIEDSAGLMDCSDPVADAYALGMADSEAGLYKPPAPKAEFDAYIRGQNDAWAIAQNVKWWSRTNGR